MLGSIGTQPGHTVRINLLLLVPEDEPVPKSATLVSMPARRRRVEVRPGVQVAVPYHSGASGMGFSSPGQRR